MYAINLDSLFIIGHRTLTVQYTLTIQLRIHQQPRNLHLVILTVDCYQCYFLNDINGWTSLVRVPL